MPLLPEQRRRRQQLLRELAELEAMEKNDAVSREAAGGTAAAGVTGRAKRSVRDLVLDALDELGFMAYAQQLTLYIKARFGREVGPTRFGTLSVDEDRAF